jgi:hypothetical protein
MKRGWPSKIRDVDVEFDFNYNFFTPLLFDQQTGTCVTFPR